MLCFEPDRDKLDIQLQAAREAVDHAEQNTRDLIAAWEAQKYRYRWVIRELAYRLTIGWEDMATANFLRYVICADDEMVQEVLDEHEARREKDSMNA